MNFQTEIAHQGPSPMENVDPRQKIIVQFQDTQDKEKVHSFQGQSGLCAYFSAETLES